MTEGWTSPHVTWLRGGRAIRGATLRTHRIAIADVGALLACRATSTDPAGGLAETSVAVRVPLVRPLSVARPRIRGIARVGRRVRCELGTWRLARTYVVRWRRGACTIPRATARTYLLRSADRGRLIRCRVTARNAAGSLTISSLGRLVR